MAAAMDGHHRREEEEAGTGAGDVESALGHGDGLAVTLNTRLLYNAKYDLPHDAPLRVKFILPALTEATSPYWRPIKYSLFPPLGLATLAAYPAARTTRPCIVDEHVAAAAPSTTTPDLVVIQVYITNAYRAYRIADHYRAAACSWRSAGCTSRRFPTRPRRTPTRSSSGRASRRFPQFLAGFPRRQAAAPIYRSTAGRTLERLPPIRRDLIARRRYLVPNSIVVTRGCPQHCDFCYKDAFFQGGRSFYTQRVDAALAEIARLPGRHLYFLDDHLLGDRRFAAALFDGMRGMRPSVPGRGDRGLDPPRRSDRAGGGGRPAQPVRRLRDPDARQPRAAATSARISGRDYAAVTDRLHDLGIMINGSFVFGMDDDDEDVFRRTVDWAIEHGITTATFHIQTPYPGTGLLRAHGGARVAC